jgi:hypothetical protein
MYEPGVRVTATRGASIVAKVVEPYFERAWDHFSSHAQTPGAKLTRWAAAVLNEWAQTAYIAYPVFGAFANHGNYPYRLLVRNLLERLLPQPLVRVCGPTGLEATIMHQDKTAAHPARTIVHLLYYAAERRTKTLDIAEDIVPLYEVPLSLKLPSEPTRVYLAPKPGREAPVDSEYLDGRVNLRVPVVRGHQMVVFEQG